MEQATHWRADPERLLEQHADMVYRIALAHTKNTADAEDVFQEVFLRLVRHSEDLQSEEHAKAWLIRVTANCAKTLLGSAWRRNTAPMVDETLPGGQEVRAGDESGVMAALQSLPDKYRIPLHLFYYEDLAVRQIADILQESETNIKTRLSRGRKRLQTLLKGSGL